MLGCKSAKDPVDFGKVARMVGTRRHIDLAGAATEMRHGTIPATTANDIGKSLCIVAAGRSFQAMKQDQQGLC